MSHRIIERDKVVEKKKDLNKMDLQDTLDAICAGLAALQAQGIKFPSNTKKLIEDRQKLHDKYNKGVT